jgi:hypothetical protein
MKLVAWFFGVVTLVASGAYAAISLGRWEWNRALFFAVVFLAAEVGLAAALVLRRVDQLDDRMRRRDEQLVEDALAAVRQGRTAHRRFEWLDVDRRDLTTRTNVFITMVVGGGVLLSGLAWVVDKVASLTTDRGREASLAKDLEAIRYPPDGILVDDVTVLARSGPRRDDPRVDALLGKQRRAT